MIQHEVLFNSLILNENMGGEKAGASNKPGSVIDNHSSGIAVTSYLKQPTRESARDRRWQTRRPAHSPIWSCSGRGLPCRELLPVARCALTAPFHPYLPSRTKTGGIFSVALSMGSRPPGVTWRPVRRSPDFPLQANAYSDCLVDSDFLGRRILHVRRRLMGHWVLIYPNGSQAALYFE